MLVCVYSWDTGQPPLPSGHVTQPLRALWPHLRAINRSENNSGWIPWEAVSLALQVEPFID